MLRFHCDHLSQYSPPPGPREWACVCWDALPVKEGVGTADPSEGSLWPARTAGSGKEGKEGDRTGGCLSAGPKARWQDGARAQRAHQEACYECCGYLYSVCHLEPGPEGPEAQGEAAKPQVRAERRGCDSLPLTDCARVGVLGGGSAMKGVGPRECLGCPCSPLRRKGLLPSPLANVASEQLQDCALRRERGRKRGLGWSPSQRTVPCGSGV